MNRLTLILMLVLTVSLVSACSAHRLPHRVDVPLSPPATSRVESEQLSWWAIRFRIAWPEDTDRDQAMALLLADAVVAPVLRHYAGQIAWWRFHRRAARDHAGHQLSVLFYSNPAVAARMVADIQQSEVLQSALGAGKVEKVRYPDTDKPDRPGIEFYSDSSWPLAIQRTWPSYIMGVSAMWLGLIDELRDHEPEQGEDFDLLLEQYREVDQQIFDLWYEEGQHALLHHLSAVFGYQPIRIRKAIRF